MHTIWMALPSLQPPGASTRPTSGKVSPGGGLVLGLALGLGLVLGRGLGKGLGLGLALVRGLGLRLSWNWGQGWGWTPAAPGAPHQASSRE